MGHIAACFRFVLSNLASKPHSDSDSFDYDDWFHSLSHARQGASSGSDGGRVDLIQQLVHYDDCLGHMLFERHLAIAHGLSRALTVEENAKDAAFHRLLYMLPVLLTACSPSPQKSRTSIARAIVGRCTKFQSFQWAELHAQNAVLGLACSAPLVPKGTKDAQHNDAESDDDSSSLPSGLASKTTARQRRSVEKDIDVGQVGHAASVLSSVGVVVTRKACDHASPSGELWASVLCKLDILHSPPLHKSDPAHHPTPPGQATWKTVLDAPSRAIHFASKGMVLFKGDPELWKAIVADYDAYAADPDALHSRFGGDWGVRPIAIGTSHHRAIARAHSFGH